MDLVLHVDHYQMQKRGKGVKYPENFADLLYIWSLVPVNIFNLDRVYNGLHDILTYVLTRGLLGLLKGTASAFLILLVKRCRGLSHCPLQGVVKP